MLPVRLGVGLSTRAPWEPEALPGWGRVRPRLTAGAYTTSWARIASSPSDKRCLIGAAEAAIEAAPWARDAGERRESHVDAGKT